MSTQELSCAIKSILDPQISNRHSRVQRSPTKASSKRVVTHELSEVPSVQSLGSTLDGAPDAIKNTRNPPSLGGHMPFAGKFVIGQESKQRTDHKQRNLPVLHKQISSKSDALQETEKLTRGTCNRTDKMKKIREGLAKQIPLTPSTYLI